MGRSADSFRFLRDTLQEGMLKYCELGTVRSNVIQKKRMVLFILMFVNHHLFLQWVIQVDILVLLHHMPSEG